MGEAGLAEVFEGEDFAGGDEFVELVGEGDEFGVEREAFVVGGGGDERELRARGFELGGEGLAGLAGSEGEGDEGGGDVEVLEGSGHGIFAADGGEAESLLGVEGS